MYGQNDQKGTAMNLIHFEGKLYYALKPVNSLFNSILIREVYTRGDFLACDLQTGDMTVLPGTARLAGKNINASRRRVIGTEFNSAVLRALSQMNEAYGTLSVISAADKRLAEVLREEQTNLNDAELVISDLQVQLNDRINAAAMAFEGIDDMQGHAMMRHGYAACARIKNGRGVLSEAAGLISGKTAHERKTGLQLLRKLEEVYLPKEEPLVAARAATSWLAASEIEPAADVAKEAVPKAKRVRKSVAPKE